MHFFVSIFFLTLSCQAAPQPTVTSTNISTKLLPSSTSPLAQLLATATASENTDVTPTVFQLAATQRTKRKPKKFRPKGESRFIPTIGRNPAVNILQRPNSSKIERVKKSSFSGFSKRPRPSPDNHITSSENTEQNNREGKVTTAQPSLVLQDYFGTPVPKDSPTEDNSGPFIVKPTFPIPFVLSNDISSDRFDQSALFERLQSITGAQPVGVTRDIAQHTQHTNGHLKQNKHKQISHPKGRKGSSHRKVVPQTSLPEEVEHKNLESVVNRKDSARQLSNPVGRKSSRIGSPSKLPQEQKDILPHRHKKPQKVKKRNHEKSFVGTLDRYQYKNEDGSITWGYQNEDGGFKEETIGMDCITHGRYGYTDPSGQQREYGYTSGVQCDPHTRKVGVSDTGSDGSRGTNGNGFFDYTHNRFVMPDGRRVTVVVNQHNKARGKRY